MGLRVVQLVAACPGNAGTVRQSSALAHGGDDAEVRRKGAHDVLDAELVVALARAAVGVGIRANPPGHFHGFEGDQRAGDGGGDGVPLVVSIRLDRGPAVLRDELLAGVYRVVLRAKRSGALLGHRDVLAFLAHIHGYGNRAIESVLLPHEG